MNMMDLNIIVLIMSFGSAFSYIPYDSSFLKSFGLVDRIKYISNALTEEEETTTPPPKPKSPLDEFPAVNPHEEPQKSSSTLFNFFRQRPNFKIKSRIFDPEAITSFLSFLQPLTSLGSDQPSSAPSQPPQPIIPQNLPDLVPVPMPFNVAPIRIVLPTMPKGNAVVPVPVPSESSASKVPYPAQRRFQRLHRY